MELISTYEQELYEDLQNLHETDVLSPIRTTGTLSDETIEALKKALSEFTDRFLKSHA